MNSSTGADVDSPKLVVVGGSSNNSLEVARGIARLLELEDAVKVNRTNFADHDAYVRISTDSGLKLEGAHVIYVQTTAPGKSDHLLELLLTVDALVQQKVDFLDLVIPYLANARQDKVFLPGEAVSARAILKAITAQGVDRLWTIDVHFWRDVGDIDFAKLQWGPLLSLGGPQMVNLTAADDLAEYIRKKLGVHKPIVAIPDKGQRPLRTRLENFFNLADNDVVLFDKKRVGYDVSLSLASGTILPKLTKREVVIFDDVMSTGITIAKVASWLKANGAEDVTLACTHVIDTVHEGKNTRDRLLEAGVSRIVTTDSIGHERPITEHIVPVAPIFARALTKPRQQQMIR